MKTITDLFKDVRERHNLSQYRLAAMLGITPQGVAKIEKGSMPGADKVMTLLRLFPDVDLREYQPVDEKGMETA